METASKPTTTLFVRLSPDLKAQVAREAQQRELSVNRWWSKFCRLLSDPGRSPRWASASAVGTEHVSGFF